MKPLRSIVSWIVPATLAGLTATALLASLGAAPASAASSPWWHLTESASPTHLWIGSDEVQELTAKESALFELSIGGTHIGFFEVAPGPFGGAFPEATAANVQKALEEADAYGAGNVEVSEAPDGSSKRLTIKTIGSDAGKGVPSLEAVHLTEAGVEAKVVTEGGSGVLRVRAFNLGDGDLEGTAAKPVTISDRLPAGVHASSITGEHTFVGAPLSKCELGAVSEERETVSSTFEEALPPYESLELIINISLAPDATAGAPLAASGAENAVSASGGNAPATSIERPITVSSEPTPFGVAEYSLAPEAEGGQADTQAGSHPFQLTTTLTFAETRETPNQPAQPRDLRFELPAGLVGNATSQPQCTPAEFDLQLQPQFHNACSADAAVGVAVLAVRTVPRETQESPIEMLRTPVYNLVPVHGEPASFGFAAGGSSVVLDTSVRSGGDYGVNVSVNETPQAVAFLSSVVTLWGDPGSAAHDASRGWSCLYTERSMEEAVGSCADASAPPQAGFLTLPTSCTGPLQSSLDANSWADASFLEPEVQSLSSESLDGCEALPFEPQVALESSAHSADSPTELTVHLKVPQKASENPEGIADSDVRNTTVSLPAELQINPAAAGGLQACSEKQVGYTGRTAEQVGGQTRYRDDFSEGEAECHEASRLGKVTITTPLLKEPLEGWVYQAAQGENPFKSLLALYVVAENKTEGVRVKLAGEVHVEGDGQLVSTFEETPQLPFGEFDLKFFGGNQGSLATTGCGAYRTESSIEPWSGGASADSLSEFAVNSGVGGGACASPGFAPSFTAGTTNNDGGAFSPFTLTLTRKDGEQSLSTVAVTMPEGLAADISKVMPCPEAEANAGDCPAASKIGHVVVQAGVGGEPSTLPEAGKPEDPVYLTEKFDGAPFGLSIVVPAEAGPFNLDENGKPVVVRAKIDVDPHTAQVSIESQPMPTRLQGIPLDVRSVEVIVNREGFTFNPTDCKAMSVTGAIGSAEGASAAVSSRFEAANCASLPFKPKLTASTKAKNSRRSGASLTVRIAYPKAGEANIAKVRVQLPKKLPTREETLKFACTEAQFDANPAGCPAASRVGTATAVTPVLKSPLTGPAYFVSFGHAKFPDLIAVLQAEGVTIDLAGETFISKKGITTSTFGSVPDEPVSSFALTLPEGAHSALTAQGGNLCEDKLVMPTQITGQNGAFIQQSTMIEVQGCSKTVAFAGHHVKGRDAKVTVYVPAAGKLTLSGKGVGAKSKKATGRGTVSVELHQKKAGKLRTTVTVAFKPKKGKKQTKELKLDFKK